MISYKHTQIGYLMLTIALPILAVFVRIYTMALAEPPSINSGPNFAISLIMVLTLFILSSFITLTVAIDKEYLRIKFGYGIFARKFLLNQIISVKTVKNRWYYGWGIRGWFWPNYIVIYNVSGFDAVEITTKNGKIYRIGTDESKELEFAIKQATNLN